MQAQTQTVSFKGQKFQLSVTVASQKPEAFLQISLSSEPNAARPSKKLEYLHQFSPDYIENMTLKTGNFKKFSVFCEMLLSGMDKSTNTISLEIFSMKDLQNSNSSFVGRKHEEGSDEKPTTKLYLIITYAVAFDRVHYPLPLVLKEETDYLDLYSKYVETERERSASVNELALVMRENDRLKHAIKNNANPDIIQGNLVLDDIRRSLSDINAKLKGSQKCKHHVINAELRTIVNTLYRNFFFLDSQRGVKDIKPTTSTYSRSLSSNHLSKPSSKNHHTRSLSANASQISKFDPPAPPKKPYTVIKSEPLDRGKNKRKPQQGKTFSNPSPPPKAPFRRFDPTEYVREREARLERSRSGSRSRSVSNSRLSIGGSRNNPSNQGSRNSVNNQRSRNVKSMHKSPPRRNASLSKERSRKQNVYEDATIPLTTMYYNETLPIKANVRNSKKPFRKEDSDPDPDMIDVRLEKLQMFLQNALI